MHKQHEDQPSNELPNLSTWHRVPDGATIPAGTPYAYVYDDEVTLRLKGTFVELDVREYGSYYTEHPIAPPLPTEDGATIAVSSDERPPSVLLTRKGGRWVNSHGVEWYNNEIHAWAPVAIGETVVIQ